MNKSELIGAVAEKSGFTKKDSEKVVNAVFDTITDYLSKGESADYWFWNLYVRPREAREGRNPLRGKPLLSLL